MKHIKLSEIADIIMGQSPEGHTCNNDGRGLPLLNGPAEFTDFAPLPVQYTSDPKKESKEGSILFCVRGSTTGRMNWSNGRFAIGRGLASISHKGGVEYNHYLRYLLEVNMSSILRLTGGSTFPNLTNDNLSEFEFFIPPNNNEKAISAFLRALDSKIELNNRINAELEAMAKTIYDYWFVQFDFPDKNGKPYKSSGGKMVWNEELKREVPEGWEVGKLGDVADLVRGVTYDSSEILQQGDSAAIPILRATNISGNVIDQKDMVYVPKRIVSDAQKLNKFDILITMSSGSKDHIGKNGFFYFDDEVSFGAFCAKIVAKDNFRFYVYSYAQSSFMFNTIKNECLGTNINNLNNGLVKGFKIVIPPKHVLHDFNQIVASLHEKIGNNHRENKLLTNVRDWLLPMLMNGQVKVV